MPCPTDSGLLDIFLYELHKESPQLAKKMQDIKSTILEEQGVIQAATDFKLIKEVAELFGLQWDDAVVGVNPHHWAIEKEVTAKPPIEISDQIRKSRKLYFDVYYS
jgi:hypothetical protein